MATPHCRNAKLRLWHFAGEIKLYYYRKLNNTVHRVEIRKYLMQIRKQSASFLNIDCDVAGNGQASANCQA